MLEVHNFATDQSMAVLEIGKSRTIEGYFSLIHIIDLDSYNDQIANMSAIVEEFGKQSILQDSAKMCMLKLKNVMTKLDTLNPYRRKKRGLINGLGSAIKFITGNMDANDAETINKQLQDLENITYESAGIMQNQKNLNQQMIERFKNLTGHINYQQDVINKFLTKLSRETSNSIKREDTILEEMQYMNQLNLNIDLLSDHISDIIDSIMLAKLGTISKLILHPEETTVIRNIFKSQKIDLISDQHIYELLELQAYYNNNNLIFNVKIPNFSNETYTLYHLIPLPINETMRIITKPYINYNNQSIQYFTDPCPRIENTHFCKKPAATEETDKSTCIGNIITGKTPSCPLEDVGHISSIFQPENNYIIFINIKQLLITSTCSKPNFTIKGNSLIRFSNCSVTAASVTYKDNPLYFWDQIMITPPNYNKIKASSISDTFNLIKLRDYTFNNGYDILNLKQYTTTRNNIILGSLIILGIILVCSSIILWKKSSIKFYPEQLKVALAPSTSLWPSLYNKGGGVTLGPPPSKPPRMTTP